jgi:hypothetical protein
MSALFLFTCLAQIAFRSKGEIMLAMFAVSFAMATHPKYMLYVFDQQKKTLIMIDSTHVEK